jgi:hypothetical protein
VRSLKLKECAAHSFASSPLAQKGEAEGEGSRPCWPCCLNKPSPSPLPTGGEATIRTQHVSSARPSELTVGQHYPSLTTRAVPLSRARCYFVEEIIKKATSSSRSRHRDSLRLRRCNSPDFVHQGSGEEQSSCHSRQFTMCNCSHRTLLVLPFSFSIGRVPPGCLAAFVLASSFIQTGGFHGGITSLEFAG